MQKHVFWSVMVTVMTGSMLGSGETQAGPPGLTLEAMAKRLHQLEVRNEQLLKRVEYLEKASKIQQKVEKPPRVTASAKEEKPAGTMERHPTLSGTVEVEAMAGDDFDGTSVGDISLATVEVGIDTPVNSWVTGHLLFKFEEGEEDDHVIVDEGTIHIGNPATFPFDLTVGRFYMPFGTFATQMIQDPLTLELGEINATGLKMGFAKAGISGALYGYRGMSETGSSDTIRGWGAHLGYTFAQDGFATHIDLGWVNNLADASTISNLVSAGGHDTIDHYVSGFTGSCQITLGPVSLVGEYVTALDNFSADTMDFDGQGARPWAWNVEVAASTQLAGREMMFAAGYQGTREALALGLSRNRFICAAGIEIFTATTFTLEYYSDQDYVRGDGGTGDSAKAVTAQIAYEF